MSEADPASALSAGERKTIARVEAFSDIVFGFSLFNLAINLRVPASSHELIAQIPQFAVFGATFFLLSNLWWVHHRLFSDCFKPDGAGIALNFAFLGSVALFTYPLQLYFKFGIQDPVTIAGYAASGLLVYGLIAAMFYKGLRQMGSALTDERRATARGIANRLSIFAGTLLLGLLLSPLGSRFMTYPIAAGAIGVTALRVIESRKKGPSYNR